jgi:predicted ATPase
MGDKPDTTTTDPVTTMTAAEWKASIARALARLGLSYDDLRDMARRQDFSSTEARKLWLAIR